MRSILIAVLPFGLAFVGCNPPNGVVGNPPAPVASVPAVNANPPPVKATRLLDNESFWGSFNGQVTINCRLEQCFPKDLAALVGCEARCLFTTAGYGLPEAVTRAFAGKKPVARGHTPNFIVAYGPPGSGKSTIVPALQHTAPADFPELDETTVSVNVDDVFQGGDVGKSYKKYREEIVTHTQDPEKRTLYTQRLYTYYRWIADQIADGILNQALAAKYNVLWETTGASKWPRHEIARINEYAYRTVVVYPVVDTEELIKRVHQRAQTDQQEAAPPEVIRQIVQKAQENLLELLPASPHFKRDACPENEKYCRAKRVIILDNNGEKGQESIIFDSKAPTRYCNEQNLTFINELAEALDAYANCQRNHLMMQ